MNKKAIIVGYGPQGPIYRNNAKNDQTDLVQEVDKKAIYDSETVELVYHKKDESKRSRRKPYQPVRFADHTPLEGYYNDGTGNLYSVARLIDMCKDLPVFEAPLQAFDLSYHPWQDYTIFDLAYHVKAVNDADLSYPIILDWNGSIADGRHRLIKALILGHTTIKCVRMYWKPEADKQI